MANSPRPYAVQEQWSRARQEGFKPYRWLDTAGNWTTQPDQAATFDSWKQAREHAERFTTGGHFELVVPQSREEKTRLELQD